MTATLTEPVVTVKNRYKYIDGGGKHLHTLDGKPLFGASTVKGIIGNKEKLFQYYADRAAVCALSLPIEDITEEYERIQKITDWRIKTREMDKLKKASPNFAHARLAATRHRDGAAKKGSARHGKLEDYVRSCFKQNNGKPYLPNPEELTTYAQEVRTWIFWCLQEVDYYYFTEANCYHEGLWTGGIADLGLRLKDGRRVVCDHKSSTSAYSDQFLQCAIYDLLLEHSGGLDRNGNKLFDWKLADGYIVFPFRSDPFMPEFRWNADAWRKGAEGAVDLYRLMEIN